MDALRYRALRWLAGQESKVIKHAEEVAGLTTPDDWNYSPERFDALADAAITLAPADVAGPVWKPIETAPDADGFYLYRSAEDREDGYAEVAFYRKGENSWHALDGFFFGDIPGATWAEIPK